jgi:hypothetical protein
VTRVKLGNIIAKDGGKRASHELEGKDQTNKTKFIILLRQS